MKTILYRISDKYFPGVKIIEPFHAKVNYDYKQGVVKILDVALSLGCLTHIDNTKGMVRQMKVDIEAAEKKKGEMHPVIKQTIGVFAPALYEDEHDNNGPTGHGDTCYSDADSGL